MSKKMSTQQPGNCGQVNTILYQRDYFCPTNSPNSFKFRNAKWSVFTNYLGRKNACLCIFVRILEDQRLWQTCNENEKNKNKRRRIWRGIWIWEEEEIDRTWLRGPLGLFMQRGKESKKKGSHSHGKKLNENERFPQLEKRKEWQGKNISRVHEEGIRMNCL